MLVNSSGWAVLFDLDETLVLTSQLAELRRKRDWGTVYRSFLRTDVPPGTHDCLQCIRAANHAIGVVTKSPRPYAERLLHHHGLDIPVLVAYHDVRYRKPQPEGLLKAAASLLITPARCIYVGDDQDDVTAARAAGMGLVTVCWASGDKRVQMPRACGDWAQVISEIKDLINEGSR